MMTLFTILLVGLLFACSTSNEDGLDDHEDNATSIKPIGDGNENEATSIQPIGDVDGNENEDTSIGTVAEATFIGTIEEINGDNALVSIEEGEILNSGNKVDVNLSVASDTTFEIGDKVRVGYDGHIREIFPLGINTTFVELID